LEPVTIQSDQKLDYAGTHTPSPVEDESRPGVGSFVMSLFFFVPFLTGLMAIVLGVVALESRSGATDRAFGIAGMIIGSVCVIGWTIFVVTAGRI
jgi:hypothetical protein